MALIMCPECSSKISNLAKSCPQCGYPIDLSDAHNASADPAGVSDKIPFDKTEGESDDDDDDRESNGIGNSPHDYDCSCQQCNYYRREASKPTAIETAGKAMNWFVNRLLGLFVIGVAILFAYFQIGGYYAFMGTLIVGALILFYA